MSPRSYRSFAEPLAVNAEALPEFLAFIYVDDDECEHKMTFAELHERALGVAHDLLASAQPGDRALLLLPPGLDYVATIFGCFYAGVIGVSAPPPQPRRSSPASRSRRRSSIFTGSRASRARGSSSTAHFTRATW